MIPALGFMIGSYIIFRMIEVLLFSGSRYSGKFQHITAIILAGVVALLTFVNMIDLAVAGSRASNKLLP